MNLRQAESAINADIEVLFCRETKVFTAVATAGPGDETIVAAAMSKKESLKRLVEYFYELFGQEALKRAEYRCERCGRFAGLQRHHKIHRARGQRNDAPENLEIVCMSCHAQEHGG